MGILFLIYPILELYLIVKFSQNFGFFNLLFLMISTGLLGIGLMIVLGQSTFKTLQYSIIQAEVPASKILHRGLMFLGAFFLFLPGILTDVMGILLLLPGFRHLISLYFKFLIAKGIAKGSVKIFGWGASASNNERGFVKEAKSIQPEVIETSHTRIE